MCGSCCKQVWGRVRTVWRYFLYVTRVFLSMGVMCALWRLIRILLFAFPSMPAYMYVGWQYFISRPRHRLICSVAVSHRPRNRVDVFFPPNSFSVGGAPIPPQTKRPLVFILSGGAWTIGSKLFVAQWGFALSDAGYVAVAADYRNFPQTSIPGMVRDIDSAFRFAVGSCSPSLSKLAPGTAAYTTATSTARIIGTLCDISRVTVLGHSAGAHLVALWLARSSLARPLCSAPSTPGRLDSSIASKPPGTAPVTSQQASTVAQAGPCVSVWGPLSVSPAPLCQARRLPHVSAGGGGEGCPPPLSGPVRKLLLCKCGCDCSICSGGPSVWAERCSVAAAAAAVCAEWVLAPCCEHDYPPLMDGELLERVAGVVLCSGPYDIYGLEPHYECRGMPLRVLRGISGGRLDAVSVARVRLRHGRLEVLLGRCAACGGRVFFTLGCFSFCCDAACVGSAPSPSLQLLASVPEVPVQPSSQFSLRCSSAPTSDTSSTSRMTARLPFVSGPASHSSMLDGGFRRSASSAASSLSVVVGPLPFPPTLLIHGTADMSAPPTATVELAHLLRSATPKAECEYILVAGQSHTGALIEGPLRGDGDVYPRIAAAVAMVGVNATHAAVVREHAAGVEGRTIQTATVGGCGGIECANACPDNSTHSDGLGSASGGYEGPSLLKGAQLSNVARQLQLRGSGFSGDGSSDEGVVGASRFPWADGEDGVLRWRGVLAVRKFLASVSSSLNPF